MINAYNMYMDDYGKSWTLSSKQIALFFYVKYNRMVSIKKITAKISHYS